MARSKQNINPIKLARIAGYLYLSLIPLGIFGILYVPNNLIVEGDLASTIGNIVTHVGLFRLSIVTAFLIPLVNMFVAFALYGLLKSVNRFQAQLMVIFLLAAVPIAMINELNHYAVLALLSGADYPSVFTISELHGFIGLFLDIHKYGIFIAQIFWGLWLFPMGYLIYKSGFLPRVIGLLLMIGCFGYVIDSLLFFLDPNISFTLSQFTFFGELILPLWLVIKGVNVDQWQKQAIESAL
ncbi:MAG: DUF4386 domain-containing protein [Candidatus Marinimicrobia bacterium]|nr:DUF4386 domain-containing protein [Candidatus Neomarinimicrobiota bacterium]